MNYIMKNEADDGKDLKAKSADVLFLFVSFCILHFVTYVCSGGGSTNASK